MTFREKAAKATVSKKITRRKWSKQDFKLVAEVFSACQIQLSSILAISTYAGISALKRTLMACLLQSAITVDSADYCKKLTA